MNDHTRSALVRLALLALLLSASACSTAGATPMPDETYPPRPDDWKVEVWIDPLAPAFLIEAVGKDRLGLGPEDAKVIGTFKAENTEYGKGSTIPVRMAIQEAKIEVRKIGGDGMVIRTGRASRDGAKIQGEVIRYRD